MPPKALKNSKESIEKEGRVLLAISAIKKAEISSIREAARVYNVSHTILRRRLNGITSRSEIRANSHKMTQNEEESLGRWILSLNQRGAPPRPCHVREMANILLAERSTTPVQTAGVNWVTNFIKRHDELKTCYARRYNYRRAKCDNPQIIKEWFDRVQITIMQYGIATEDIYNFDETGFAMGLVATTQVVTRADMYQKGLFVQPGNREWVTSIECINSTGWSLPPCIIFKGKVHIEGWYQEPSLPHDWRIEVSPNGWTSDEIGLRWLKKLFIPATTGRTVGKYRLLILDGHGSHLTPQFDKICSKNDIIPICMPAHSSHRLQPLDVSCFKPLKDAYGGLIAAKAKAGVNHIDKLDFLKAFPEARTTAFKSETIQNSFAGAGIVPFDPERVLEKLGIQLKTPSPPGSRPSSRSTNSVPKTPHNLKQLKKQETTIQKLLRTHMQSPSSPTKAALNQLVKGAELAFHDMAILKEEMKTFRAIYEDQAKKKKRSTRQLATTEGLSIQEGLERFQRENEVYEAQDTIPIDPALSTVKPRVRAPPRCSDCHILGHTRRQCSNQVPN
jgi:hypothetical protein